MIRRPPSAIPLRQSDIDDLEAFLAEKLSEAKEQREQAEAEQGSMEVEVQGQSQGKGKGASTGKSKGKGKGKASGSNTAAAPADDSLVQAEEQARNNRAGRSREARIGL